VVGQPGRAYRAPPMSDTSGHARLLERFYEDALNRGDTGVLDLVLADGFRGTDPTSPVPIDRAAVKRSIAELRSALPDLRMAVERVVGGVDEVAVGWRAEGTFRAPFRGSAPTGRRVETSGITIHRFENDRIASQRSEWDALGLLTALGALPRVFRGRSPTPPVGPPLVVRALRLAASDPDRPAVVDGLGGARLSRAELAARSAAVAVGLAARGVGRGDRVAVAMPNLVSWPVVALGVWRARAVLVPVSTLWTADETRRVLDRVRPRLAIASAPSAPVVRAALPEADIVADGPAEGATPLERLLVDGEDPLAEPEVAAGELALILFSSGTGGLPKGVRWTHGRLAAESALVAHGLGIEPDSVALASAPFFHALGLFVSLCGPLSAGARVVTLAFPDTERILAAAAAHQATHAALRPPAVAEIAADADVGRHDTSRLQVAVTGGAHVPAPAQLRAGERLGCPVRQGYASTEAGLVSGPPAGPSDPDTAGRLAGDVEARLVDPDSGRDVPPGRPGELWVRGPRVTDGYDGDPAATAATITPDGWLRTGDLVAIRDDGQLVIHDRLKELIKVGGASVAPAELELVLREHPAVRDAAVVGRPHPEHGEVPVAYVAPEGTGKPAELLAFVRERVANYKRLHDIRIVAELPRSPTGKLDRRALRARERAEGRTHA
jgi:steroid delta-isomerase-like uncharacterized protein